MFVVILDLMAAHDNLIPLRESRNASQSYLDLSLTYIYIKT